jgi:polyketide cyclase/dehydrase/lipid transport protein
VDRSLVECVMTVLVIHASARIARPIEVVRRHFMDVEHHRANGIHPAIEFTLLPSAGSPNEVRHRRKTHMMGVPLVDEVVSRRQPDGSVIESFVAGDSAGTKVTFRFEGSDETEVTMTVELPLAGIRRLAAPIVRRLTQRRMIKALDEDRRDLEEGEYEA